MNILGRHQVPVILSDWAQHDDRLRVNGFAIDSGSLRLISN